MKNNPSNEKRKGSKSFYAALGISAVMIGSACYFAYDQGNRIVEEYNEGRNSYPVNTAMVDKKVTDIPRHTVTEYKAKPIVTTAPPVVTKAVTQTVTELQANAEPDISDILETAEEVIGAAEKLENLSLPLADISNVLSPFSSSELVKNETTGSWQTHNGTDIAAETGTEVFAVADGNITSVKNDALWGVTVVLDHGNGFSTKYCGLGSDLAVKQGDRVNGGNVIGVVGNTADIESSVPTHLHIEITHNGKYIDPMAKLSNN